MVLFDVAIALVAIAASTALLKWVTKKRQAALSMRSEAVDTIIALAFVVFFTATMGKLTSAIIPAFADGLMAFFVASLLTAAVIAATLCLMGWTNSVGSLVANPDR